jgi:isoamylase
VTDPMRASRSTPYPLGPTCTASGVNFSVLSVHATAMELLLFDRVEDARASRVIELSPTVDRTAQYWHVFVPGIKGGQLYGLRVAGPYDPAAGHRFDPTKLLLDPYAKSVAVGPDYSRAAAAAPGDNAGSAMKSVVTDPHAYTWEGDQPLQQKYRNTVIYEMHVRGFTQNPNSGIEPSKRGTYAAIIEKIPYLLELGITAVELMPIFQFDAQDCAPGLTNYWGYSPVSFFAPHLAYSIQGDPLRCIDEFRDMVKALHRAGIEVILDVVYNHTSENDEEGPTLCFRGLENSFYYLLDKDSGRYLNYSGTGNTLNANHSVVRRMILDSLRYWVSEMHVDGFRFDLASILSRNEQGEPTANAPILWDIDSDPTLAGTKLMAEAWDAAGLYQVGSFVGDKWKEWNGRFRDDVRAFIKGDANTVWNFHQRILGSPDVYRSGSSVAGQGIHFITCHDGFTLNDLVSYNQKHNAANRELGRDGAEVNLSWNCGVEGPSVDHEVEFLRSRQIKNMLAVTLLSGGTPLLLMGDEVRRTQFGNNNPYCQDNELSWFDWADCARNVELQRYVKLLIRRRLQFMRDENGHSLSLGDYLTHARFEWHGVEIGHPDWSLNSHSIAYTVRRTNLRHAFHVMVNAYWDVLEFHLPPTTGTGFEWHRLIDTYLPSPNDIAEGINLSGVPGFSYPVQPRSIVVLSLEGYPPSPV